MAYIVNNDEAVPERRRYTNALGFQTAPLGSLTPRAREGDFRDPEIAGDVRTISVDINPWGATGNRFTRRSGDVSPFFSPLLVFLHQY